MAVLIGTVYFDGQSGMCGNFVGNFSNRRCFVNGWGINKIISKQRFRFIDSKAFICGFSGVFAGNCFAAAVSVQDCRFSGYVTQVPAGHNSQLDDFCAGQYREHRLVKTDGYEGLPEITSSFHYLDGRIYDVIQHGFFDRDEDFLPDYLWTILSLIYQGVLSIHDENGHSYGFRDQRGKLIRISQEQAQQWLADLIEAIFNRNSGYPGNRYSDFGYSDFGYSDLSRLRRLLLSCMDNNKGSGLAQGNGQKQTDKTSSQSDLHTKLQLLSLARLEDFLWRLKQLLNQNLPQDELIRRLKALCVEFFNDTSWLQMHDRQLKRKIARFIHPDRYARDESKARIAGECWRITEDIISQPAAAHGMSVAEPQLLDMFLVVQLGVILLIFVAAQLVPFFG